MQGYNPLVLAKSSRLKMGSSIDGNSPQQH
jgi:hypothetical protein